MLSVILLNEYFYFWNIYWTNLLSSLISFYNISFIIVKKLKVNNFKRFLFRVNICPKLYFNLFCSFSFDLIIIDCWLVFSCWLYQSLLITILVLVYDFKLYVICIQTGHRDLLPSNFCGMPWQGCRLGVTSCWHKYIVLIDKNLLQVLCTSLLLLIVEFCIFHLLGQRSFILKLFLGFDCKYYVSRIQNRYTYFLPSQVCGRSWQGC